MKFWDFTPGQTRYMHVYLIFPGDNDFWVDCIPFAHPVTFEALNRKQWRAGDDFVRKLVATGEATKTDEAGVTTRVLIKEEPIEKCWGQADERKKKAREQAEQEMLKNKAKGNMA